MNTTEVIMDNLTLELSVAHDDSMNGTIQEPSDFLSVLCGQPYWNSAKAWDTNDPDLGVCIEKTILLWTPCLFLWLSAVAQFIYIRKRVYDPIPWTALTFIRVMVSGLLVISAALDLVWILIKRNTDSSREMTTVDIIASTLLLLTYSLQLATVLFLRYVGIRSSGILWFFNLLMIFLGIPTIKTIFSGSIHRTYAMSALESGIYFIQYLSCTVLLIAQSIHDSPSKSQRYHKSKNPSPEEWASFPSLITFSWSFPIMWRGCRQPLKHEDLYSLPTRHSANVLATELKKAAKGNVSKKKKKNTSMIWLLFKIFRMELLFIGVLYAGSQTMSFFGPEILSWLIEFAGNFDEPIWRGLFYAFLLFVTQETYTLFRNFYFYHIMLTTVRCRSVLMQNIYRKSLQLSAAGRRQATLGEIVNLMAVDTYRISDCFVNIYSAIGAPFIMIMCLILLWERLGAAVLSGLVILLIQVPINTYISNKIKVLQTEQMKHKDSRLKLISEIINGIKVLKMYAWEESFVKQVEDIRGKETNILRKIAMLNCQSAFFFNVTPTLVALTSFATYLFISDSNELNAEKAFVSLALFNIMRFPLMALPNMISQCIQAKVALKRMDRYLAAPEIDRAAITKNPKEKAAILVEGGQFTWGGEIDTDSGDIKDEFRLQNIDLKVKSGSLVAVVGTVGSGKSSLISALLGEMEKKNGHIVVNGSVAYVSQVAWLQNATLRENITWGKPYHSQRYKSIINACALQPDLDMLPGGDQTEVGEKGINLSGGQKQRLSMARAVYSDADIYFLDDPLSAVDAHVGKHMFNHVIGPKGLLRNKTRILVTHAVSILPQVDEVIVVKDGNIQEKGTYAELIQGEGEVAQFFQHHKTQDIETDDSEEEEAYDFVDETKDYRAEALKVKQSLRRLSRRMSSEGSEGVSNLLRKGSFMESSDSFTSKPIDCAHEEAVGQTLIEEEKSETGMVSSKVYVVYWRAMGLIFFIMPVIFLAAAQASLAGSNLWLSYCSNQATDGFNSTGNFDRNAFLLGYGGFGLLQALTLLAGVLMVMLGCVKAALVLHDRLLGSVMKLPMSFFDTNPSGRIMNRFSKEIDVLDNTMPGNFRVAITYTMQVIFTVVIIMISTPEAGYAVVPIMILYILIQRMYVATVRQLKRIESVGKSPIYSHFSETIQGLSVIRAFGKGRVFRIESMRKVDHYLTAAYNTIAVNRWLGVTLETMGNIITLSAALLVVLSRGAISPGNVGLTISYALNVTLQLNWVVRVISDVEANIVSVERIKEYVETTKEAAWRLCSGKELSKAWPQEGAIDFKDYQMRYRPGLDLVLKGISFSVKSAEKIGIVGRTGAGKSSLTSSLFRLVEPAGGSITIDSQDVSQIGLHDLREKLSIIPQDPVLFSGPLRINLDPFNLHNDESLWRSLEHANLHTFVRNQSLGLQHNIEEGGANLSVGQRQLMCLARALLRQSRVLVLDEATAAVDLDTDDLIQETIRREFKHCTVLTIAHRLKTILDYDRVLVLDKGMIAEFDSPSYLLTDKNSIFYGMAKDAGLISS